MVLPQRNSLGAKTAEGLGHCLLTVFLGLSAGSVTVIAQHVQLVVIVGEILLSVANSIGGGRETLCVRLVHIGVLADRRALSGPDPACNR